MKNTLRLVLILATMLFGSLAFADTPQNSSQQPQAQEVVVRIKQDNESNKATSAVDTANEWVNFGQHVGQAMDAGLSSLTKNANAFANTPAGHFTMAVIAWKVAGKDAIDVLNRIKAVFIGVPLLLVWNMLCVWFWRRNFMAYKVVTESTGNIFWSTKKYTVVNVEDSWEDGKCAAAAFTGIIWAASTIGILIAIVF